MTGTYRRAHPYQTQLGNPVHYVSPPTRTRTGEKSNEAYYNDSSRLCGIDDTLRPLTIRIIFMINLMTIVTMSMGSILSIVNKAPWYHGHGRQ